MHGLPTFAAHLNMAFMSEETVTPSTRKYWLLFALSTFLTILMLIFVNEWFWVGLPFVLTFFVQALDKM
ncbi:MAG: hypothetical protein AAFQ02_06855 [Bacteroidota bacterium]